MRASSVLVGVTVLLATAGSASASNIVINPDFSAGNTGFTSAYSNMAGPGSCFNPAVYSIVSSPVDCHPLWADFGDHTTGGGDMMAINGATTAGVGVWSETVPVVPNTQYFFSAWIASSRPESPALLNFAINGVAIGGIFGASTTTGKWELFFAPWFSGSDAMASIALVNQNTAFSGNDFALDDISLDTTPPSGGTDTTVPEPTAFSLIGATAVAMWLRRFQRSRGWRR